MDTDREEVSISDLGDTFAGQISDYRRLRWPEALERQIVAERLEPGSSVSIIARRHDVNAQRSSACYPCRGWPTSHRNGRDQIETTGRLHSTINGQVRPECAPRSNDRRR